jgi:hypothetical protein
MFGIQRGENASTLTAIMLLYTSVGRVTKEMSLSVLYAFVRGKSGVTC